MSLQTKKSKDLSSVSHTQKPYRDDSFLNTVSSLFPISDTNPFGIDKSGHLSWPMSQPLVPFQPLVPPHTPIQPLQWVPSQTASTSFIVSSPVVEPTFKLKDLVYTLRVPLLGYKRESITAKIVNGNLAIVASDGGLEGNEAASFCIKIPKDADLGFDSVLLNGVLTITTNTLPVVELAITIR